MRHHFQDHAAKRAVLGQALTPEQDRSAFRALHTWLLGATENGTVIRQEAASMVTE